MSSKLIALFQRAYGWRLWTGIMLAALLAVEVIVAVLDLFFYGHVISEDMIKGLVATAIVEPTHVFFMIYLMGQFSKGQIKNLESDVAYANQRFRVAVEISQLNVWEMNLITNEILYDDDALKVLGIQIDTAPHDLPGWLAVMHPDDRAPLMARFQSTLQPGGTPFDFEYRVAHPNGQWGWAHTRGEIARRDAAGNPLWAIGSTLNVTARKNAEIALQEEKNRFEIIFNSTPELMLISRLNDGVITHVNEAAVRISGYTHAEIIGNSTIRMGIWKRVEDRQKMLDALTQTGRCHNLEVEVSSKNGEMFVGSVSAVITLIDGLPHIVSTVRDVTERKRLELELRRSETLLRSTLESTDEGILMIAQDGHVLSANRRFMELWRVPKELLATGQDDLLIAHVLEQLTNPDVFIHQVQRLYNSYEEARDILHFKDGRVFARFTRALSVDEERGRIWCFKDITEEAHTQSALIEGKEILRVSEQKMLTILDNVAAYIYLKDVQGNYLFANRKVRELWQVEMIDVIGFSDEKFFDAETAAAIRSNDSRVLQGGEIIKAEETNTIPATGKTFTYLSTKLPLRNENGSIYALCGISTDITERIHLEAVLRASQMRLNLALAAAQMGVWEFDFASQKLYWSDEIYRHLGMPYFEPTLEKMAEFIHPDDADIPHQAMQKAVHQGCPYFAVYRLVVGGKTYWAEDRAEVQYDEKGNPRTAVGTAQDITARKNIEQALAISEASLRASQVVAGLGTYVLDIKSDEWSSSAVLDNMLGIDESYVHSVMGWENLIHVEDRSMMHDYFLHEVIGKKNDFQKEYRIVRPSDNGVRWVHGLGRLEWDKAGNPSKMFGTIQDITARKENEEQLLIAATAFESQEGMMITDAQTRIVKVNAAFTEITGYNAEEVIGRFPNVLSSGCQDSSFYKNMWDIIHTTGTWKGELFNRRKNGEIYPEFLMISVVKNPQGVVTNYVGTLTDSTQRMQILDQLRTAADSLAEANVQIENERSLLAERVEERTAQLHEANHAKDAFLATMSHEIRTPLGGLLGMMELLGLSKLNAEQSEMVSAAYYSGKSLLRIVDDILDWSKIEAKKLVLAPHVASVRDMLANVMNTYAPVAAAKGIDLKLVMPAGFTEKHFFDPLRVAQIINNFTSNAIKFTERGAVTIALNWLETHEGYDTVRFEVQDSGIGIAAEQQARLFRHYEQASADTARMYGGTGLGLSICLSLADLLQGKITVQSTQWVGSTFGFEIKLSMAQAASPTSFADIAVPKSSVAMPVTPLQIDGQAVSILVVDDHPLNRMLLKQQLSLLGLQAEVAADGTEALLLWQDGKFDLIITDCHMPEMDGYEFTRRVRALEKNASRVPIIAWTANVLSAEEAHCRDAGMDDFLTKPTELAVLKETLLKWLVNARIAMPPGRDLVAVQDESLALKNTDVLDLNVLKKIAVRHEAQIEFLREFNTENRLDVANLKAALQENNSVAVMRSAHRIKGASRMVGALQLEKLSGRIEQAAKDGDVQRACADAEQFLDQTLTQLEAAIAKVAS